MIERTRTRTRKVAVVLFNLGGPDDLSAVRPFLFNLFNDPAIISLPGLFRWPIARLMSWRRAPVARDIYRQLGGRSPLLEETERQAGALEKALNDDADEGSVFRCFAAMRYWHPRASEAVAAVRDFSPDKIVQLPLYPQFSTTTTQSSFDEWSREARKAGLNVPARICCCFPTEKGFIEAQARAIYKILQAAGGAGPYRLLLSAHGLPKKIVDRGDPYAWQVGQTAKAIVARLRELSGGEAADHVVCYQSRVGPLEWLKPDIESEIRRAGSEGLSLVVVPIAFVSEHSETLVELDIKYAGLAKTAGVPVYRRVPTPGTDAIFIESLARMTMESLDAAGPKRICPAEHCRCFLAGQSVNHVTEG